MLAARNRIMSPMSTTTQPPKPKRRWLRFSLMTLLVVVMVACLGFAVIGWRMQRARENRETLASVTEAVAEIEKLGGEVSGEYLMNRPQFWWESQLDDPGPVSPVGITFTKMTDARLEHLKGLENLRWWLYLNGTNVTDAGLEHLTGLSNLEALDLTGTRVTAEGVKKLQQALPNCKISR